MIYRRTKEALPTVFHIIGDKKYAKSYLIECEVPLINEKMSTIREFPQTLLFILELFREKNISFFLFKMHFMIVFVFES